MFVWSCRHKSNMFDTRFIAALSNAHVFVRYVFKYAPTVVTASPVVMMGNKYISVCWYIQRAYIYQSYGDQLLSLQWRHNGRDSVSNHQPDDCLLNRLFRRRSKKTSKLRVTGLRAGNSPMTGEFPAQMASNSESVSIWWRHHVPDLKSLFPSLSPPMKCIILGFCAVSYICILYLCTEEQRDDLFKNT